MQLNLIGLAIALDSLIKFHLAAAVEESGWPLQYTTHPKRGQIRIARAIGLRTKCLLSVLTNLASVERERIPSFAHLKGSQKVGLLSNHAEVN